MTPLKVCPACLRIEWFRRPDGLLQCKWCRHTEGA